MKIDVDDCHFGDFELEDLERAKVFLLSIKA